VVADVFKGKDVVGCFEEEQDGLKSPLNNNL
jgi:hypothetical protein